VKSPKTFQNLLKTPPENGGVFGMKGREKHKLLAKYAKIVYI
jgi:hypothetical protein